MKLFEYIEKPEKLRRVKIGCWVTLFLVVLIDFFIPRHHIVFWWDDIPGFDAIYGFLACLIIIFVSKAIGHMGISQPESFYDKDTRND